MKKLFLLGVLTVAGTFLYACTTFFINKNGQMIFGRNYDWITDAGMVYSNQKGLSKTSMKTEDGETINWVSLYGSITFNQYGKEFPTGGMNEKGLVVELMWLDGSEYPAADNRPAIGVLQWIQYQLDNSATIDEVIATDKKLRIASKGTVPLHYLVADAGGNAATIEFLDGKMVVHKGNELKQPVLTNSVYEESVKFHESKEKGGSNSFAYGNNSLERFDQACSMIRELKNNDKKIPVIDYAFKILDKVSQGSDTKWSIVYDITNRTINFKTERFKEVKMVRFSSFDFTCNTSSKSWEMNQIGSGDVSQKFESYTAQINQKLVEKAFTESAKIIDVPEQFREYVWRYSAGISCR